MSRYRTLHVAGNFVNAVLLIIPSLHVIPTEIYWTQYGLNVAYISIMLFFLIGFNYLPTSLEAMKDSVRRKHINELRELGEWFKRKRNGENSEDTRV